MRHRSALFTAVILLFLGVVQVARGDDKDIDRLVKQLGSGKFKEREAASSALGKVGKPALTALRKAAKDSDPEIRSRAAKLILAMQDLLVRPIDLGPGPSGRPDPLDRVQLLEIVCP